MEFHVLNYLDFADLRTNTEELLWSLDIAAKKVQKLIFKYGNFPNTMINIVPEAIPRMVAISVSSTKFSYFQLRRLCKRIR